MATINKSDSVDNNEGKVASKIGRPIDKKRDLAILKAALELVAERGYNCVTMDAIALKAHAGKATLYRRWKSKPSLIAEAIGFMMPCEQKFDFNQCGDNLRDYLCELLSIYFGIRDEVRQKVMLSIATAINSDKHLSEVIHLDCITNQTCIFSDAIECTINKKLDKEQLNLLANVGPALLFYQLMISGKPIKMNYVEHIVDHLIIPLVELNKE
ncbi:MAG: TetR/AcrR family transcriptional regulator [Clostridium sp.]|uniref:TetR/AcrR family transcriptional regulator n=1 Tax=Clostridium sp. TaxID=1506 RepID=UPI003D6D8AE0